MINLLLFCFTDITDILKSLEEEKRDEECDEDMCMWFNVVVGTNIVNYYRFIYNLS
jgi:hypothetical protein